MTELPAVLALREEGLFQLRLRQHAALDQQLPDTLRHDRIVRQGCARTRNLGAFGPGRTLPGPHPGGAAWYPRRTPLLRPSPGRRSGRASDAALSSVREPVRRNAQVLPFVRVP